MNRIKKMEMATVHKFAMKDMEFMDKLGEGKIPWLIMV
jgi:hypothetical protein